MQEPVRSPRAHDAGVRPYDFRRPGKFSKEHLRTLQMVHENFARLVTTYFLATVRAMVKTLSVRVEQTTFPEFIQSLDDPTVLSVFSLAPLPGSSLLVVAPPLAHALIHRLFGGQGPAMSSSRSLTEIEIAVMQRVLAGLLNVLKEAWSNLTSVTPSLQAIETNPMYTSLSALNEVAVVIHIETELGEQNGQIQLCVPFLTLEPILVQLSASQWFGVQNQTALENQGTRMQRKVHAVQVPIVAQLSAARLTAREVLGLGVGDVVLLDSFASEVTVLIGSEAKFLARPAVRSGRRAIELTATLGEVEADA